MHMQLPVSSIACSKSATSLVGGNEPFSIPSNFFSYLSNVPPKKKNKKKVLIKYLSLFQKLLTNYFCISCTCHYKKIF